MEDALYMLEHLNVLSLSHQRKCAEQYGFPREIILDATVPSSVKYTLITTLIDCLVAPEKETEYQHHR